MSIQSAIPESSRRATRPARTPSPARPARSTTALRSARTAAAADGLAEVIPIGTTAGSTDGTTGTSSPTTIERPPSAPIEPLRASSSPRPAEVVHLHWTNGSPRPLLASDLVAGARPARLATPATLPTPVLKDPTAMCCSVVLATAEVLRGIRPLAQLTRWLTPEIFEAIARRREITVTTGPPLSTRQVMIRRARVLRLSNTIAEATVVIQDMDRVRAAAIRVEHLRGNWRVVAFELG